MKKLILIVEDEDDLAALLSYHLQKENYQTVIARNGDEAIDAVQCHEPDAILLDIMMPELDGWDVCRNLRESTKGKTLPIIMISALSDEKDRIKGLSLGADDYVSKPYSMKELLLKIGRHIDRHQMIKEMKAREQEQNTAVQYMIHEMKNAMAVIGGYSSRALTKDDPRNYLKPIHIAAMHAESLLNNASLLSQLENTRGNLTTEAIDLVAVANDVVDMVRDMAKKRRIEIAVMKSTPLLVRVNRTAVRQVLLNLLSNAIKYNRADGRVWLYFDDGDGMVDVSIRDDGNGIGCEELPKIFDKFYRAAGSEKIKGAGLGLYIVKVLTETMGGKISAESDRGFGSTFTVSFPEENASSLRPAREVA